MKFTVETEYPIAWKSVDHLHPRGTLRDNSVNLQFNSKLEHWLDKKPISIIDLGCAGGGMVKSFVDAGHRAVGIEGSDWPKQQGKPNWQAIPGNLFTADCTKPFTVKGNDKLFKADVITAWEFFEHIHERDLLAVVENIKRHLKPGGLVIATISLFNSPGEYRYHQTVTTKQWWMDYFRVYGLIHDLNIVKFFEPDWVHKGSGSFATVMRRE